MIGRSFDLELLAQVVDTDESRLLDQLEAAVGASLLEESTERVGRFRFVHALINQTLYDGLGATRRARMHQRVAQALDELYGADPGERLGELALHWRLATVAVDRPKAADYAARAGQQALDSLAPAEAAGCSATRSSCSAPATRSQRCRALIGLGEAQRLIGDTGYRDTLLEASRIASALADPGLAARAVLENSRGLPNVIGEVDNDLLAAIARALELDDHLDPARRARLLGIQALELTYDPSSVTRRRAIADDAIALARDAGDPAALACVLRDAWHAVWSADTVAQIAEITDELLRVAGSGSDPALQWWATHRDLIVSVMSGRFERAADALEELEKIADGLGQPALRWHAAAVRTSWEQLHGHLDTSEEQRERALALGQDAVPSNAAQYYAGNLGFVRIHQGRGEEVIAMVEGVSPPTPEFRPGVAVSRRLLQDWLIREGGGDRRRCGPGSLRPGST